MAKFKKTAIILIGRFAITICLKLCNQHGKTATNKKKLLTFSFVFVAAAAVAVGIINRKAADNIVVDLIVWFRRKHV